MKNPTAKHAVGYAALLVCLGIFIPPSGIADIYFWTDADGVRHFADMPPRGDVSAVRQFREIPYAAATGRDKQTDAGLTSARGVRESRFDDRKHGRNQPNTQRGRRPQTTPRSVGNGRQIAAPLPEWSDRDRSGRYRRTRHRSSQCERGVSSGLTRIVRAIPSPYYMGYRPVYSRHSAYRSGGRRPGGHSYNRSAGGSRRGGGRARAAFR